MSRNLLPSALSYLEENNELRIAHLIQIDLAESIGGSVYSYVTDYMGNIEWAGNQYQAGKVIEVGGVSQTQGFINYKVKVTIAGEFEEELKKALTDYTSYSYIGRRIKILRAYIGKDGQIIPFDASTNGPMEYFTGEVSDISVSESTTSGSSTVTWECTGAFEDFELINGRITEDKAHRGIETVNGIEVPSSSAKKPAYQTDTGFQHATRAIEATIKYTTTETRYKMSSSWFGLKSKMKTYEATVTNELDLGIALSARYLPIVYGVRKVEGIPVFVDATTQGSVLYVVYAVCEGEIDAFLDIYIDGKPSICADSSDAESRLCYGNQANGDTLSAVPGIGGASATSGTNHGDTFTLTNEKSNIKFTVYHGTSNQTADPVLVAKAAQNKFAGQSELGIGSTYWDANSKLLDTAYIVAEVPITEDQTSIPKIEAVVSGRRTSIYTSEGVEIQNQYTLNPVWHLLDYITNPIFGGTLSISDVDLHSFWEVADYYQQKDSGTESSYEGLWVKYWRYIGWNFPEGVNSPGDLPRLQCNTYIKGGEPVTSNVKALLEQMEGTLNILGTKYHLSIESDAAPIADIHIGECIGAAPTKTKDSTNKSKWNSIQATIADPAKLWQNNQVSFFNSAYKTKDNGIDKKGNVGFPHITNYYTARYWSELKLNKSRYSRSIDLVLPPKYVFLYPNANVTYTNPRFEYSQKTFRVSRTTLLSNGGISVTLQDYDSSIFTPTDQTDESSNQVPIIPVVRAPTGLEYIQVSEAPITPVKPNVYGLLCWNPSASSGVFQYDVADWVDGDSRYSVASTQTIEVDGVEKVYIEIDNVTPGTEYTFRVRAVNHQGNVSRYSELVKTIFVGNDPNSLNAPSNFRVTNEAVNGIWVGSSLSMAWDIPEVVEGINNYAIEVRSADNSLPFGVHYVGPGASSFDYTVALNLADYAANNSNAVSVYRNVSLRIRSENADASITSDWVYLNESD